MQKCAGYDAPRRGVAVRSYPSPKVRGATESARVQWHRSSQGELPHVQGAVAAWAQEGREKLLHVQGQEGHL